MLSLCLIWPGVFSSSSSGIDLLVLARGGSRGDVWGDLAYNYQSNFIYNVFFAIR